MNYSYHIMFLVVLFTLFSCKEKSTMDVNETIQKFNLNYQTQPMRDAINNSLHGDGLLFATIHYNRITDSLLYILRNYKNDTLLVQLDKGIGNYCLSQVVSQKDNYFLLLRDFEKMKPPHVFTSLCSTPNIPDSYKIDDYVKFFKIDTINRKMTLIERTHDSEIINHIKKHFELEGDFYMVHPPLEAIAAFDYNKINALITVAKDTLKNHQLYYQVAATFEPHKIDKGFELSPSFDEINYVGLFQENISYWEEYIGNTKESKITYKYYYYYLNPVDSFYSLPKKLNKIEIISYYDNKEYVISTLKEEDIYKLDAEIEIEKNVGIVSTFRPGMFRYYNGEYYFTTFTPRIEYTERLPPIYHLDTLQWKLNKVELFDPLVDKKYSRIQKIAPLLITGRFTRVTDFFEGLEIVKVNNEYRLIKKGK